MVKKESIDFDRILEDISNGMTIDDACKKSGVIKGTFLYQIRKDKELFDQYTRAREIKAEQFVESMEDDLRKIEKKELDPASGRVIIDTKKWLASKFYPKMYGEKQAVELTGKDGASLAPPVINVVLEDGNEDDSETS